MERLAREAPRDRCTSERIAAIPASAEVRAVFLQIACSALPADARSAWSARFGEPPRAYSMMPVREYLERLESAALAIAPSLAVGLAQLHARAVGFLLAQPGADLFVSARERDPGRLLDRLESSRSLIASYGSWRVTRESKRSATIVVENEYAWLDLLWVPILASIFPACGTQGEIECEIHGPFSGRLQARW